jgi:SAM-dependent methyltransferase
METSTALIAESTFSERGVSHQITQAKPRLNARNACRVCGSPRLTPYLNLGKQALANDVRSADAPLGARFPLVVQACAHCRLSQLTYVAPKEALYTTYAYSSGVSAGWRQHCAELAAEFARPDSHVIDVASNDGTLIQAFAERGCWTLGIEPSISFADADYAKRTAYWTSDLARDPEIYGHADVLIAQNVLGHVDDVHDFMAGVALALTPNGTAIVEVPYLGSLFDTLAFDTVYHEHLSYWSITALQRLCHEHGLVLTDVRWLAVHGGSARALIRKTGTASQAVMSAIVNEMHDLRRSTYEQFSARVTRRIAEIIAELLQHTPYVGFGAAAKTAVMLGCLDVRAYPYVVYDDAAAKQGKAIPGTRVPIEAAPTNWRTAPGPMCLFAWNWASTIIPRLRRAGYTGAIYTPLPHPRWDIA